MLADIKKIPGHLLNTIDIKLHEKKYRSFRYLLKTNPDSNTLIISFSGYPGKYPAHYNYMRTLKPIKANQLFILDNFGYQKRGSYYLGENGSLFLTEEIPAFVKELCEKLSIRHIYTIGSSMGGFASLYYGCKLHANGIIAGAPQYHLGDYLGTDDHLPICEGITGKSDAAAVNLLNRQLPEALSACKEAKPEIYLHYSPNEPTYPAHIADLLADLKKLAFTVYEDNAYDYEKHSDVGVHFPAYLVNILSKKA